MTKPIIAFDCDDVIVQSGTLLINYYNQLHGTNVQPKDFYSKDYEYVWKNNSKTVARDLFAYLLTDDYLNAQPMSDAIDVLRALSKRFTLYIVTGRPQETKQATLDWVNKYLPGNNATANVTNSEYIQSAVKEAKASVTLPKEVDTITRLEDITGTNDAIVYNYTLHDIAPSQISQDELKNQVTKEVCATASTKQILDRGISLDYNYVFQGTTDKLAFKVLKSDCSS